MVDEKAPTAAEKAEEKKERAATARHEKAETKARAEKQESGLPALENRVAALERVVLGGAPPEGLSGIRAPSAEKTAEAQAEVDAAEAEKAKAKK